MRCNRQGGWVGGGGGVWGRRNVHVARARFTCAACCACNDVPARIGACGREGTVRAGLLCARASSWVRRVYLFVRIMPDALRWAAAVAAAAAASNGFLGCTWRSSLYTTLYGALPVALWEREHGGSANGPFSTHHVLKGLRYDSGWVWWYDASGNHVALCAYDRSRARAPISAISAPCCIVTIAIGRRWADGHSATSDSPQTWGCTAVIYTYGCIQQDGRTCGTNDRPSVGRVGGREGERRR